VVIEIKRDAIPKVVINNLYKSTQLETLRRAVRRLTAPHQNAGGIKELLHREIAGCGDGGCDCKAVEERGKFLVGVARLPWAI